MGKSILKNNGYRFVNEVNGSVVFALLLVAVGALLLLFNTGVFPLEWRVFFFSWQMLLIVLGILSVFKLNFIWGIILMAVGKFFLFSEITKIYPEAFEYEQFFCTYWPVGLVVIGILILFSILARPLGLNNCSKGKCGGKHAVNENESKDGEINYKLVFTASEQVLLEPIFKGGKIDVSFAGLELDLRRTSLLEGETYLNINVAFGGVALTVPDTWDIELRSNSFAGGISDSRKKFNTEKDYTRKLIVVAKCSFGGIDIK